MAIHHGQARPQSTARTWSRASRPRYRLVAAGLAAAVALAAAIAGVAATSGSPTDHVKNPPPARETAPAGGVRQGTQAVDYARRPVKTSGNAYGYVPAWLGRAKVPVGRVVTASSAHPWLAIQGDTVRVKLLGRQVLATVSGPAIPRHRHLLVPKTSPCTFSVTLTEASAPIAILPRQFAAIDEQGRLHTLTVTNENGSQPASEVTPGQTVELKMYTVLPTGQGRLIWSPLPRRPPPVQWDFDVETD